MFDLKPADALDRSIADRRAWILAAVLLALHAYLCWQGQELGVLLMRDDSRYLNLAHSIAAGAYNDIHLVGAPPHSLYPPGFPVVLLTWGSIVADTFSSYILLNTIFSTATILFVFSAVKRVWGPLIGLFCLLPLALNPFLIVRAGGLRSETAYIFFSILALWALSRARPATVTLVVAALAALLAALTRSIGITLLASIGLLWLSQRRYKAATILAIASLLTIGVWIAWTFMAPHQLPGTNYLGDLVNIGRFEKPNLLRVIWRRTGFRFWVYFGQSIPWAIPLPTISGTPIDNLLGTAALVASLTAGTMVFLRRWRAAGLYLILYALALMVWPFQRLRFLEPSLPLLIPALLIGAGALASRYRPKWALGTIAVLSLTITATAGYRTFDHVTERMECDAFDLEHPPECMSPQQASFLRAVHYIAENIPSDQLVHSAMPEPLYYYTGHRSILGESAVFVKPESFLEFLDESGVDWVLLTPGAPRLATQLQPHCDRIRLEERFWVRTVLFRVSPSAAPASVEQPAPDGAPDACTALAEYLDLHPGDTETPGSE